MPFCHLQLDYLPVELILQSFNLSSTLNHSFIELVLVALFQAILLRSQTISFDSLCLPDNADFIHSISSQLLWLNQQLVPSSYIPFLKLLYPFCKVILESVLNLSAVIHSAIDSIQPLLIYSLEFEASSSSYPPSNGTYLPFLFLIKLYPFHFPLPFFVTKA